MLAIVAAAAVAVIQVPFTLPRTDDTFNVLRAACEGAASATSAGCEGLRKPVLTSADIAFLRQVVGAARHAPSRTPVSLDVATAAPLAGSPLVAAPPPAKAPHGLVGVVEDRARADASRRVRQLLITTVCGGPSRPYLARICGTVEGLPLSMSLTSAGARLEASALRDLEQLPEIALQRDGAATDKAKASALFALVFTRTLREGRGALDVLANLSAVACAPQTSFEPAVASALCSASHVAAAITAQTGWASATTPSAARYLALAAASTYERMTPEASAGDAARMNALLAVFEPSVAAAEAIASRAAASAAAPSAVPKAQSRLELAAALISLIAAASAAPSPTLEAPALQAAMRAAQFSVAAEAGDAAAMALAMDDLLRSVAVVLPDPVAKATPLVVELAAARSSGDVAAAVAGAVEPEEGYVAKFERRVVAANAFLGATLGLEWIRQGDDGKVAGAASVFAPIGLHLTTPLPPSLAFGIFLGVVDFGTLVSARFTSEEKKDGATGNTAKVAAQANLSLTQIFAPGLFATLSVFRSPLVFGAGIELCPALHKETTTAPDGATVATREVPALRALGFAAVDLPLLPF